jgi:hypothetical protein
MQTAMSPRFRSWLDCALWTGLACFALSGCRAQHDAQRRSTTSPASTSVKRPPAAPSGSAKSGVDAPFAPPELDLPAERLHEHVDGAEPWLQSIGCRRLLFWRLTNPEVELEILVFGTEAGAKQALDKDAGNERGQASPGDEGWTNGQVVYFRRGTRYCRLIADRSPPVNGLMEHARRVDRAIVAGELGK